MPRSWGWQPWGSPRSARPTGPARNRASLPWVRKSSRLFPLCSLPRASSQKRSGTQSFQNSLKDPLWRKSSARRCTPRENPPKSSPTGPPGSCFVFSRFIRPFSFKFRQLSSSNQLLHRFESDSDHILSRFSFKFFNIFIFFYQRSA